MIRKHFFKYLHPKEAFVGNGCLNKELVRVAKGESKKGDQKQGKYAKRYRDTKDELGERDENGGLKFVYPYGATLNVHRPAVQVHVLVYNCTLPDVLHRSISPLNSNDAQSPCNRSHAT